VTAWKRQLAIIVRERGESVVDPKWWARTFDIPAEEVSQERDRLVAERDAIDTIRARPENSELGQ
jgi:hypothetical protein